MTATHTRREHFRADGSPLPIRSTRMFGRCTGPRCRTRVVVEVQVIDTAGCGELVIDADRARMDDAANAALRAGCCPDGRMIMQPNGSIVHGMIRWTGLRARRDATIRCTSRCTGGRGFECRCECGGEQHGASAAH